MKNHGLICLWQDVDSDFLKYVITAFKNLEIDWIHVGQESGNRAGRIRATREMIQPFFDLEDIPVFMKNNLAGICGDRPLRKEFPVL